jgi:hypothetical protein
VFIKWINIINIKLFCQFELILKTTLIEKRRLWKLHKLRHTDGYVNYGYKNAVT